jgi:hypothetical protein
MSSRPNEEPNPESFHKSLNTNDDHESSHVSLNENDVIQVLKPKSIRAKASLGTIWL